MLVPARRSCRRRRLKMPQTRTRVRECRKDRRSRDILLCPENRADLPCLLLMLWAFFQTASEKNLQEGYVDLGGAASMFFGRSTACTSSHLVQTTTAMMTMMMITRTQAAATVTYHTRGPAWCMVGQQGRSYTTRPQDVDSFNLDGFYATVSPSEFD